MKRISLSLTAAILVILGACEDSMTAQVQRDLDVARTPDRTLTIDAPISGAVTPAPGSLTVKDGSATAVSYTAPNGTTFLRWDQTGGSGTAKFADPLAVSTKVTLTGGNASITPRSTTTPRQLTIGPDFATRGSTSPASPATVGDGQAANIQATANPGWTFVTWAKTSGAGTVAFGNATNASTTVTVTGGDAVIEADFAAGTYNVIVSGAHGTYSPTGTVPMPGGTNTTQVTATPDTDYVFASWAVSPSANLSLSPNATSATVQVTAKGAATLTASYTVKKYALTVNAGSNGTAGSSVAQLTAGTSTSIWAVPNTGYHFTGWTTSTATTVTFGDPSSASTSVVLHGGAGTVTANFAATTYSMTVDATYAPGTDDMPSTFTAAAVSGTNLLVLGSVPTVGNPSIPMGLIRSISVASVAGLSNGSAGNNVTYIDQYPQALTVDASHNFYASVHSKLWKGPDTGLANLSFSPASIAAHDLAWDGTANKLLILSESFPRTIRRATPAMVLDATTSYSLDDTASQNSLAINRMFAFGSSVPAVVTGWQSGHNVAYSHLGVFPGAGTVQTWLNQSSEDMTAGAGGAWDVTGNNPDEITAVSPLDDISQAALVSTNVDGDDYLWYYDITAGATPTYLGKQYLGGTGHAVRANAVYWYGGVPWVAVGGTKDGKATVWIFDGNPANPPVFTYQIPNYATVLWIYAGAGGDANKNEYYAVVKKTLSGTDKLEVVALGFHF